MLRVLLLAAVLLSPLALADAETGRGFGARVGSGGAGLGSFEVTLGESNYAVWQAYWWNATAGARTLGLSWGPSVPPIPWADYDLHLYRPGTLDDNLVLESERLASSAAHPAAAHAESIAYTVPASGLYVVMVAPWQAQGEPFTLTSSAGDLAFAADVPAVRSPTVGFGG